jgi:hypothetical protein
MKWLRFALLVLFICCVPMFSYACPEDSESTAGSGHKVPSKASIAALVIISGATTYWIYKSISQKYFYVVQ